MPNKRTDNYNKDYFTTSGIPQPGAETDTEKQKRKLAQSEKAARKGDETGPEQDADIARAMGKKPSGGN